MTDAPCIKHREIAFDTLQPGPQQVLTAIQVLQDLEGVEAARATGDHRLEVSYDLRHVSLQMIEELLVELGFHLDNSLVYKLRRALYYYTEDNERTRVGVQHGDPNDTREVFISRYARMRHGCRDERPGYWRRYL